MPCDEIREVTVSLIVANEDVLKRALVAAGFKNVRGTLKSGITARTRDGAEFEIVAGEITLSGSYVRTKDAEQVAGQIKVAYSNEAIRTAAKAQGWTLSPSKIKKGAQELSKRAW